MNTETSLFSLLHKWAWRQDENFVTEAFAYLLRYMAHTRSSAISEVMEKLTNCPGVLPENERDRLAIITQSTTDMGRPDIEISAPQFLLYVEVKVDSEDDPDQLRKYRHNLNQEQRLGNKLLVLLTRDVAKDASRRIVDHATRWIWVADWLDNTAASHLADDPVGHFLVEQFTSFLATRNMAMKRIHEHLPEGIKSLRSLFLMVAESARACGLRPRGSMASKYLGYNCDRGKETNRYWVGVSFAWPNCLWFQTYDMFIDKAIPGRLGIGGEVEEKAWAPSGYAWTVALDLSSENGAFFQASASEQYHRVESFLRDCLDKVRRIEDAQKK